MKKLIIIMFSLLTVSFKLHAQATKIKSFAGDSIWLPKGAKQVTAIVVTGGVDTARSILYNFRASRDTTLIVGVEILFFDKQGAYITMKTLPFNGALFTHWTPLINRLDVFINNQIPRIVLH